MKYVSRIVFGLSIAAVLALFTACPQANNQSGSIPEALTGVRAVQGWRAKQIALFAKGDPAVDYDKVVITAKKVGSVEDVALKRGGFSGQTYTAEKENVDFISGMFFDMPEAGTAYTFTITLLKDVNAIPLIKGTTTTNIVGQSSVTGISKKE